MREPRTPATQFRRNLLQLRRSYKKFRFADALFSSLGSVDIPLLTPDRIPPIFITTDVVSADITALLGHDVLDSESLVADTFEGRLRKRIKVSDFKKSDGKQMSDIVIDAWSVPLSRHLGHIYASFVFSPRMYFTRIQLMKLHKKFAHPSAQKLCNLLKSSRPEDATPETLRILEGLAKRCDPCQRIQNAPNRFCVSFGVENVRFNERLLIDIMYLEGKAVLHIVDEGTRFSAARFVSDVSTMTIWKTVITCWATIYTGLPRKILVDQGSQFSDLFISLGAVSNVEVRLTGIESHNSLGIGERYHQPLRNTFRKLRIAYPDKEREPLLCFAVKALNDTLEPDGIVPSALVFGEFPSPYTVSATRHLRALLESRAEVANMARREMEKGLATARVKRGLRHAVPQAENNTLEVGHEVLVWREGMVENRIGEWIGPFRIHAVDQKRKLVFVQDVRFGSARPFNLTQVKWYHSPEAINHSFFSDMREGLFDLRSPSDVDVHLTEILTPAYARTNSRKMSEAKHEEIPNLLNRRTFRVVLREDIPTDANLLPGRFVLSIKSTFDGQTKFKARYVIGGHRDKLKHFMVHSSQTLQPSSVRFLLSLDSLYGFDFWTSDVLQAYLQSSESLMRDVFIKDPVPAFELDPSQCLKLLRPLYSLCESGDLRHGTLDAHHRNDLGMMPLRIESALYAFMVDGHLKGLSGTYVDDLIRAGDKELKKLSNATAKKFDMADEEHPPCSFTGFRLEKDENGTLSIDQKSYVKSIRPLSTDATYSDFASLRMKLSWLTHTQPDCCSKVSQLAQVTKKVETELSTIVRSCNKLSMHVHDQALKIKIPKLELDSLRVIGFSDASFASNADFTSQHGYISFLADASNNAIPIIMKSYKARRVTRSVMAAEVIRFSDMFDVCHTLSEDLRTLIKDKFIAAELYTDSKSLFDVISMGSRTAEKDLYSMLRQPGRDS